MNRQMKDSGIAWIGEIPEGWKVVRTKNIFTPKKEIVGNESSSTQLLSLTTQGIKAVQVGSTSGKVPESYDTYQVVKKDNMVFCLFDLDCSAVFSGLSQYNGMISPAYKVVEFYNGFAPRFYAYWFDYIFDGRKYKYLSKNIRYSLTYDEFAALGIVSPPLSEQRGIAEFLDTKCAEVDELLKVQEAFIDELKAYKQSLITETVTKGLDPTAKMKNSGVEWIGDIPEGWEVDTIGSLYSLRQEKVSDKDYQPLSVGKMGVVPQLETAAKTDDGDNRKLVRVGDFAINSRSDRRGSCGISAYEGSVSLINTIITPRKEMCPQFYNWFFHTERFADEFYKWGHGIVDDLWTTRWQEMKRISVIVPPLAEQEAIAAYLDTKCAEIDQLIALKQKKTETLQDYRKSLIYEYVTGKKQL